jgi:dynein heavy chain
MQFHSASVEPRRDDIRAGGKEIHKLMRDTMDNIKPDKKGYVWLQYVDYVNTLVIEGITIAINSSMEYLGEQINLKANAQNMWSPIFEIRVDLAEGDLSFLPSIAMNDRQNGIRDVINEFVNDFISIAIQIPRLDTRDTGSGDYLVEIKDQFVLFGTM